MNNHPRHKTLITNEDTTIQNPKLKKKTIKSHSNRNTGKGKSPGSRWSSCPGGPDRRRRRRRWAPWRAGASQRLPDPSGTSPCRRSRRDVWASQGRWLLKTTTASPPYKAVRHRQDCPCLGWKAWAPRASFLLSLCLSVSFSPFLLCLLFLFPEFYYC